MAGATRWASQAAQNALLRFNPQRSALAAQIREAGENYGSTVRAGRVTARETERSTQRALPAIAAAYSKADAALQPGVTLVSGDLAAPGVNPNLKAGAAQEIQQQLANLASARASGTQAMLDRGVRAREGAQFSQLNAQQVLTRTLSQLFQRGQGLSQEQGAFAQSEAEKLAHEAETLEQRERGSERSAATSRANTQESTAGAERRSERSAASKRGGAKEMTPQQQQKAASAVSSLRGYAKTLLGSGLNRAQIVERLSAAEPSISTKSKSGASLNIPGRKAYAPDVLMSAALDEALGHYVSAGTQHRLETAGYSLRRLGLRPAPAKGSQRQQVEGGVNATGRKLQKALEGVL